MLYVNLAYSCQHPIPHPSIVTRAHLPVLIYFPLSFNIYTVQQIVKAIFFMPIVTKKIASFLPKILYKCLRTTLTSTSMKIAQMLSCKIPLPTQLLWKEGLLMSQESARELILYNNFYIDINYLDSTSEKLLYEMKDACRRQIETYCSEYPDTDVLRWRELTYKHIHHDKQIGRYS